MNLQEQMLKAYIDKIFDKYDTDKSGTLDQQQLTYFFNDLFKQLGMNVTVTQQQSLQAIKSIDQNSDGGVDKKQLFDAFRMMISKPQTNMTNSYPTNPPPQQQYNQNPYQPVQHSPYGVYNPYVNQPQYNPYQQPPPPPPGYNPYGPYQQYPQYPQYPQYNQGPYGQGPYSQGGMHNSTGGSRWGRMQ